MVVVLQSNPTSSIIGCFGLACSFVGSLYLLPKKIRKLNHEDDVQVKARFIPIVIVSILSPISLLFWKKNDGEASSSINKDIGSEIKGNSLLDLIGLKSFPLINPVILPLCLFITLFAGPLVDLSLTYLNNSRATKGPGFMKYFFPNIPDSTPKQIRNILLAPFAEELVFRGCMGTLLLAAGIKPSNIICISPMFFGVAHLHHCYGMVFHQGIPISKALTVSLAQFTYTSLFGALEMYIYLRTGNLIPVFIAHSWCNLLGLPDLSFTQEYHMNYKYRKYIGLAYIFGLSIFCIALNPLTKPELYNNSYIL